jgi:16S rRNA (cytosine1402-N4)-methyltransferase
MGGHSEAILNATTPYGKVVGLDRDEEALIIAKARLSQFNGRVTLCRGSFKALLEITRELGISSVAGILFDLGVSSMQLQTPERGFSFYDSGPLDMRMDRRLEQTAADWVNTLREQELADLIYRYGEERRSRQIAAALVRYREKNGPITRTDTLADIICRVIRSKSAWQKNHPATKTFQALRIAVNDELSELDAGLSAAISLLAVEGRLAVISFHSLEDRPVKQCFRALSDSARETDRTEAEEEGRRWKRGASRFISLYKKPVVPTEEETVRNPRARSAKLRALQRVA